MATISAGKATYFYTYMDISNSPTHLYVVTNNKNFTQPNTILSIACLSCKSYKQMLVNVPDNNSESLNVIWQQVHKNSNLAYLASKFYHKNAPRSTYTSVCTKKVSDDRHPRTCLLSEVKHYFNLSLDPLESSGIKAITIDFNQFILPKGSYRYFTRRLVTKLEYKFFYRFQFQYQFLY